MIELGTNVKDTVTGFKGVATGRTLFLNGCARVMIQPKVGSDGKLPEAMWFDEPQVEQVGTKRIKTGSRNTGGPMVSIPTRASSPTR